MIHTARKAWACESCGTYAGRHRDAPEGWDTAPVRCPECIERGRMPAPVVVRWRPRTAAEKRQLVREALKRDSSASDRQMARATGTSHPFVGTVRRERAAAGKLEERKLERKPAPGAKRPPKPRRLRRPQAPKRKRGEQTVRRRLTMRERWPALAAELERDPVRSNAALGREFGCTAPTVRLVRLELEGARRIERFRANAWTGRRRAA